MMKRWFKIDSPQVCAQDIRQLREIDDSRMRTLLEELTRDKLGDVTYDKLLDEAEALEAAKRTRLSKALGLFCTQNGIIWRVMPSGSVHGLHTDGSRLRDRIEVTEDDR